MPDLEKLASAHADLPEAAQVKAGEPLAGKLDAEHARFLETLTELLDGGSIDTYQPQTFLKPDVYGALDEEWQDKVTLTLQNLAGLIRQIDDLRKQPGEHAHMENLVEQLWQMKQRIEEHHDVFVF